MTNCGGFAIFGSSCLRAVPAILLSACLSGGVVGCAQNNEPVTKQSAPADQATSAKQKQDTAGTVLNDNRTQTINIYNGASGKGASSQPSATADASTSRADGGGYVQHGLTVNLESNTTTGGTTPSIGTATASGAQTASPSLNAPLTADQTVKPVLTIPIAVGLPGSAPSAQGTAGGEGSTTSATQTNEQRAIAQDLKVTADKVAEASRLLSEAIAAMKPTTQPTSQP